MPKIWRAGRQHGLITQPDFFAARFGARWLGVVTGAVGIAALVVYVQIQLVSLSLIVQLTLGTAVSPTVAVILGAVLMLAFVVLAGLRSAAFSAAIKDILMIVIVVLLSVTVAGKVGASSPLDVLRLVDNAHPGIGKFPGLDPHSTTTSVWLMTSALNVALGNWVFPHLFQVSYAAKSGTSIRRNAIWQPLYSLAYFFIILLGFAALLAGTKPAGGSLNGALLQFVSDKYPSWLVGLVAGTAFLLALAPGSVLLLTSGSIFARNVVAPFKSGLSDRTLLLISRGSMVVFQIVGKPDSAITRRHGHEGTSPRTHDATGHPAWTIQTPRRPTGLPQHPLTQAGNTRSNMPSPTSHTAFHQHDHNKHRITGRSA
jgi:SSS family solute:Na+ symporter